ncbi:MAG: ABC-F family ATP-binding cassette domain-containing protein, partial [Bdellovibrionales bacterium]|nr:ABC-F family ATP-binding cassette domain-containing protein [Bdellovibrionales bacterium]
SINSESRIGIIGNNGSGKSTLLKIISGELHPSSGYLQNSIEDISFLKQIVDEEKYCLVNDYIWGVRPKLYLLKKNIESIDKHSQQLDWGWFTQYENEGGYDFEVAIEKNLVQMGLETSLLERPLSSLSGGEKTKVSLLRMILTQSSLFFLDEPTNHLDQESIVWLREFLSGSSFPFVLISHDRDFLNRTVNEIWEIENGRLNVYFGNYDFFKKSKSQKYHSELEQYKVQQKKVDRLKEAALERRIKAEQMENFKGQRSVKKNGGICKRDEGSGSGRANPKKKMTAAKAVEKRIQLIFEREQARKPWIEKKRKIAIPMSSPCMSSTVFRAENLGLKIKDKQIFSQVTFNIHNGEKWAIVGSNGSGKTSLIKTINGQMEKSQGIFTWSKSAVKGVFSQESHDLPGDKKVLDVVWRPDVTEQSVARMMLEGFGIKANLMQKTLNTLSPGEKVKVALVEVILSGVNTLLLDEPTNHLEIRSREILEEALSQYKGSIILVSHDFRFIERVCTNVFDISLNRDFDSVSSWKKNGHRQF